MKKNVFLNYLLFFSLLLGSLASFSQENKFGTYYNQRLSLFEKLPDTKGEIIFLGNSITDGGEWCELLGNSKAKNRGISGDTTEGVLFRLNEVTRSKPAKVFLLIGINDLSRGVSKDTVYNNICRIADRIMKDSPKTKVFVQSILPVNESFGLFKTHTNKTADVLWVNAQLKTWCEKEQVQYVDLYIRFKNPDSELMNPQVTNDGLHLTGAGYLLWVEIIKPYLTKKH
ncbi:MAG: GDSL-type esterase/lipase family protein [Bacteroidota bacterium]|nr:GDSL-type esterase/lipase family protein [Bacteroidota bacterium]